jgi:formate dehydrogenase maturation protein FdhE
MSGMEEKVKGSCPACGQGDLIGITMSVSGSDLTFMTCHLCEAKWWYREGEAVPLASVIGDVISQRT